MNKDNRIIRTLKAAKQAFFQDSKNKKADTPAQGIPVQSQTVVTVTPDPKTILDLKHDWCCGCSACQSCCPVNAIELKQDINGFYTPVLDKEKCINCGLCAKTCPVINTPKTNNPDPKCYAAMANDDEIRRQSSSGGMFSMIADYVFSQGGVVCGAALADDFSVEHIIITSPDQMYRLRGSKYAQSRLGSVFRDIKELLTSGKIVLFTGTPCQSAGLKNYLKKDYENLYVVDLVCHGSPSIMVFHRYLDETFGRENLADYKFRTKEFGYSSFNCTAITKDGRHLSAGISIDRYEKAMHSGVGLNSVCADCMFAPAPRQGDLSIGDFWGISKYKEELNDNLGTSVVLVNNPKGEALLNNVKESLKTLEEVPYTFARRNNRFGRKLRLPRGKKQFYQILRHSTLDKAVEYSLRAKYDIGVIGLWYGRNYGSMATYYALHRVLNDMGLSVLMIENALKPKNEITYTKTHPRKIADEFYDVSAKYSVDELDKLNNHCDAFIVGSDQLWNIGLSRPYKQTYFLGFADNSKKKIAYGTSFGKEYRGSEIDRAASEFNFKRFDHVSVRDTLSREICRDTFGIEAVEVCDPTFLCPMEGYEELINKANISEEDDYILAYILDPNEQVGEQLKRLSAEKGCKIIVLLDEPPWLWEGNVKNFGYLNPEQEITKPFVYEADGARIEFKYEVDLYEWLWYYKHSSSVVTDSFHGTIFSIIFEKPFLTLSNAKRGAQRFVSLLTPIGLIDRLYENADAITQNMRKLDGLDYTEPNVKLNEIRKSSRAWLKNALFSPKEIRTNCVYSVYEERKQTNE